MENCPSQQSFDPDALVDRYADQLFRYALAHVHDRSVAEDVVQETFLAALESSAQFKGQSSLQTWLFGILKHKMIDHFRRSWRQAPLADDGDETNRTDTVYSRNPMTFVKERWKFVMRGDPQADFEQKAFWNLLARGLAELNPRAATAFALREIEQLSTKDVCARMQISESNLWVMLHRARRHLRQIFEGSWI